MVVTHYHLKLLHAGSSHLLSALHKDYLIPRARRLVNSVISACKTCKRHQGRHYKYPATPDLPSERVTQSRPFENTGLDYFGPLTIRTEDSPEHKVWVCLFTCMSTRAIHLELVMNNSTTHFLLAFRRFISRRGTPSLVLSDNAPTFKLGRHVLANELTQFREEKAVLDFSTAAGFEWRFITPLSPWKGGFYERLVGSVKTALKKTVHRNTLDLWNFQTLLAEVEATLNTRPLTPFSDNPGSEPHILRPIDLITPQFSLGYLSSPNTAVTSRDPYANTDSQEYLVCQYSLLRDSLKTFWDLWHTEYLRVLAERNQLRSKNQQSTGRSPQVGDVVLIQTDNTSRSNWPLGVIVQTNPSADGSIRSVAVKLGSQKVLNRSVNQLIPLEVAAEDNDSIKQPTPRTPTRIQPPRKAKKQFIR
ncbi:unnamed protein product [Heligmosomoides polygyrus]|uniref:Integrase catalytic domain-containing protein n=1 Tax=Heligmosomoides polygyrus TaxID=6339 RepID=A0A183FA91_HELPZ|nr:unnamed protein product [Heligmosomoides polygyrus]